MNHGTSPQLIASPKGYIEIAKLSYEKLMSTKQWIMIHLFNYLLRKKDISKLKNSQLKADVNQAMKHGTSFQLFALQNGYVVIAKRLIGKLICIKQ